jgi:transcriptional regulator with XRE-family HTH domain
MAPPKSRAHARLGEAVKATREEKKLTQSQVSARMGAPATFLSDIERGIRNPAFSTLLGLSKALDVKLSELLERAGQ